MGSRGPIPAKRQRAATTATGTRLRRLPDDADAIFRRLVRDIAGLTAADVMVVENTAQWAAIAKAAYKQLRGEEKQPTPEQLLRQEIEMLLTVTDTTHGSGEESRKNPLLIVLRTASEQIRANAQQLGATPMARARMPEPEHEQMSLADILFADVPISNE